jgi:hypothetical protein
MSWRTRLGGVVGVFSLLIASVCPASYAQEKDKVLEPLASLLSIFVRNGCLSTLTSELSASGSQEGAEF